MVQSRTNSKVRTCFRVFVGEKLEIWLLGRIMLQAARCQCPCHVSLIGKLADTAVGVLEIGRALGIGDTTGVGSLWTSCLAGFTPGTGTGQNQFSNETFIFFLLLIHHLSTRFLTTYATGKPPRYVSISLSVLGACLDTDAASKSVHWLDAL